MDKCYKCEREADYACPECKSNICKYHMEFIYTGLDRGFRSRFMCPVCWLVKRRVTEEKMIKLKKTKSDYFTEKGLKLVFKSKESSFSSFFKNLTIL